MKEFFKYLHDKYGIDSNTSATIFISMLVFIAGYILTTIGKFIYSYSNKKSFQKSTEIILDDFQRACDKQAVTISDSLKTASILTSNDFVIKHITISSLPYLSNMNLHVLLTNYKTPFLSRKKIQAISKIVAIIADINYLNEDIKQVMSYFNSELRANQEQYEKNLNHLRMYNDGISFKAHHRLFSSDGELNYALAFNKIFEAWFEQGHSTELQDTYNNIITPVREITKEYIFLMDAHLNTDIALQADKAYINIEKVENLLRERSKTMAERHKTASFKIKKLVKTLKRSWTMQIATIISRKTKIFWKRKMMKLF